MENNNYYYKKSFDFININKIYKKSLEKHKNY